MWSLNLTANGTGKPVEPLKLGFETWQPNFFPAIEILVCYWKVYAGQITSMTNTSTLTNSCLSPLSDSAAFGENSPCFRVQMYKWNYVAVLESGIMVN